MELRDYWQIVKKYRYLFFGVSFLPVFVLAVYAEFRAKSFNTSLTLNITRSGVQESSDYKYDNFYRLQADDKFAETVVEWLASPRMVSDIFSAAQIDATSFDLKKLSRSIQAEKRSSQMIAVSFSAPDVPSSLRLAEAVSQVLGDFTERLNQEQHDNNWFQVVAEKPVVRENQISKDYFLGFLFLGIFLACWSVLFKHYWG